MGMSWARRVRRWRAQGRINCSKALVEGVAQTGIKG